MKYSLWIVVVLVSTTLFIVEAKKKPSDSNKKYEGDFEFVDEDEKSSQQHKAAMSERKKWIHDPSNDLCKPLNCKKKELCLLEDAYTAVCVSKKELHRNKDEVLTKNKYLEEEAKRKAEAVENGEDKFSQQDAPETSNVEDSQQEDDIFYDSNADQQEDNCKPCPVVKPVFLCGSDNKTYSSLCRLDYHNCLHATQIKVSCKGFCPCQDSIAETKKQQQWMTERTNHGTNILNSKYKKTVANVDIVDSDKEKEEKKSRSNRINSKFTFTPEDIKYDNKHYKYIKFTASNRKKDEVPTDFQQMMRDDKHKVVHEFNEVLEKQPTIKSSKINKYVMTKPVECKPQQLTAIGNRLLDWFSVIMADSKKRRQHAQKSKARFSTSCKPEAKWMFGHLDLNSDGYLSLQELYDLEHDQNEKCIKPFIDICDLDQNSVMSPREWCRCFEKTDRPCAAVRRRLNGDLVGSYAPECDKNGFYKPTQCHNSVGVCWCVDKHGVEFANTRTRDKPNCDEVINNAATTGVTSDDEDDETDDDESTEEGSADRLLVF